jgi:two-component system, NarL family, nitrate/nitrite response regulator NarL
LSRALRKVVRQPGDGIRLCIIEDHGIVRAGIRMLVERDLGIDVVCEAATASEALATAKNAQADVILLDISLRSENGLDFIPELLHELTPARVLVLTANDDVETHLLAVEAGASGVVLKEQAPEILVKAIHAIHSGESWIGRAISSAADAKLSRVRTEKKKLDPEEAKIAHLTPRERQVIAVVAQGYNGARIARELQISEATVRHHITSILSKLEVSNKLELAVFALNHGLGPETTVAVRS